MKWKILMNIVKSLEDYGLLLKGVSEAIQNEAKKQKGGFLGMLLGTLGASLLGNMLLRINKAGYGSKDLRSKVDGMIRTGYGSEGSSIKKILSFSLIL